MIKMCYSSAFPGRRDTEGHLAEKTNYHLLAKPAVAVCNLRCDYCFFLSKAGLYPGRKTRMPDAVLEAYIRQLVESQQDPDVTVAWQGGVARR